jgi:hypothetical protein
MKRDVSSKGLLNCLLRGKALLKRPIQTAEDRGIIKETCSDCWGERYHQVVETLLLREVLSTGFGNLTVEERCTIKESCSVTSKELCKDRGQETILVRRSIWGGVRKWQWNKYQTYCLGVAQALWLETTLQTSTGHILSTAEEDLQQWSNFCKYSPSQMNLGLCFGCSQIVSMLSGTYVLRCGRLLVKSRRTVVGRCLVAKDLNLG